MGLLHGPHFDHCRSMIPPLPWHPMLQVHLNNESQTTSTYPHKIPTRQRQSEVVVGCLGYVTVPSFGEHCAHGVSQDSLCSAVQQQSRGVPGMGTFGFGICGTFTCHIPDVWTTHKDRARKALTQQTRSLNTIGTNAISLSH